MMFNKVAVTSMKDMLEKSKKVPSGTRFTYIDSKGNEHEWVNARDSNGFVLDWGQGIPSEFIVPDGFIETSKFPVKVADHGGEAQKYVADHFKRFRRALVDDTRKSLFSGLGSENAEKEKLTAGEMAEIECKEDVEKMRKSFDTPIPSKERLREAFALWGSKRLQPNSMHELIAQECARYASFHLDGKYDGSSCECGGSKITFSYDRSVWKARLSPLFSSTEEMILMFKCLVSLMKEVCPEHMEFVLGGRGVHILIRYNEEFPSWIKVGE